MKTARMLTIWLVVLALLVLVVRVGEAAEMGTAFTYQGHLYDANYPADGLYDLQFKLYDSNDPCDCNQIGAVVNVPDMDVIDGYFTVALDSNDANAFNGGARWLEIGVRAGDLNDPNTYTFLSPRLELRPTPYALYARTAAAGHSLDAADGSPNDAVYVDNSGSVGIGTTNPVAALDVNGPAKILAWHDQQVDPNGYAWVGSILFQWGTAQSTQDTSEAFAFPTAFPNACFTVTVNRQAGGAVAPFLAQSFDTTNFYIDRDDDIVGSHNFNYIAIGH